MKLFVQEGGKRKAYRVSKGALAIGSGDDVQLRLESPEVAARHARVEIQPQGGVRLFLEPGVMPPKIDGVAVRDGMHLTPGRKVQFGSAFLWVEAEEQPQAKAQAAVPKVQVSGGVRRRAPRKKSGMPLWALSGVSVLVLALVFLVIWRAFLISADQAAPEADTRLSTARALIDAGRLEDAMRRLDLLKEEDLSDSEQAAADSMRAEIAEVHRNAELALENSKGARLLGWLEKYEAESLAGAPSKARVRLFLKRAAEFRKEFPEHPAIDWLDRQEPRFAGLVDLSEPPDWESVKWEARSFIRSMPRNYAAAFELVGAFAERAEQAGDDFGLDEATRYLRLRGDERDEHHDDRIATAQSLYERGEDGRAVWWLVHQVIWSGEPELADQAGRVLIKMPDADVHLRGYRDAEPEKFEALMENQTVRKYFRASEIHR